MKLDYELPEEVKTKVMHALMSDILYCVPLGMDIMGMKHKDSWFVIGEDKWLTVQAGEIERVEYIADCKDFILKPMIGNGFIKCTFDGNVAMIARFSLTEVVRFGYIVQILNQMTERLPVRLYNNDKEKTCPNCGRILIRGTNLCPKCSSKGASVMQILSMAKPYLPFLILTVLVNLVTIWIGLIEVKYYADIVDYCLAPKPGVVPPDGLEAKDYFIQLMSTVIALGLTKFFASIISSLLYTNFVQRFTRKLRKQIFDKVQSLSVNYIFNASPGDIMNRTFSDPNTINVFLTTIAANLLQAIFTFIIAMIMMLQMNWIMTIVVLIPSPISLVLQRYGWTKLYGRFNKKMRVVSDESTSYLHDVVRGIKVIKVFGTESRVNARFNALSRSLADISIKSTKLSEIVSLIAFVFTSLGPHLVLLMGGLLICQSFGVADEAAAMTMGKLTAFIGLMSRVTTPLNTLMTVPQVLADSMISVQRVYEILNQVPEIADKSESIQHRIDGNVEFEDVSFGYNSYDHVLNHVSFEVKKGEMIGLVGRSGSGKSTLINLICRFYDVNEGSIKIDGTDIRNIQVDSLKNQVGVVLQENFLFSGPLFENLRYSKPDATYEEVIRAAKIANAHEFIINLPDGYDTWVAEGGSNFSGGEKQRIAIARAILSDPAILILDEATSALDVETEAQIQEALQKLIEGRTTFAIAHRLSTLKNANRLFVMDKGKIVEMGTHDELIKKKGIYFSLVMAQRTMAKRKGKQDTVSDLLAN